MTISSLSLDIEYNGDLPKIVLEYDVKIRGKYFYVYLDKQLVIKDNPSLAIMIVRFSLSVNINL